MFLFCFLDLYAYSWREFIAPTGAPKRQTSIFRASVDAFNIFDLFVEVYRNLRWFWKAVVLRQEHIRHPRDARFDIHAPMDHRTELVRQETAAFYGDDDAADEKDFELKHHPQRTAVTSYERTLADEDDAEDDGDGEEARLAHRDRLQYPTPSHALPRSGGGGGSHFRDDDARMNEYLRLTRYR